MAIVYVYPVRHSFRLAVVPPYKQPNGPMVLFNSLRMSDVRLMI